MADLPHCPKCGYTREDSAMWMDHHLCSGKIPGGRRKAQQPAQAADAEPIYCRRVCGRIAERGVICNTCRAESEADRG